MTSGADDSERFRSTVVRVRSSTGDITGAGFVVGPNLIATCAHVVAAALGLDPANASTPTAPVLIDFPLTDSADLVPARVRRWVPISETGTGDIALLEFDPQRPVFTPPFWRFERPWGREFRMIGFPAAAPDGAWVAGEFRDTQGLGWFQLQSYPSGQPFAPGFSGAAVWDSTTGSVVGMAVAADRRSFTRSAWMIPINDVLGADPTLLPSPYRGLETFTEDDARLFYGRDAEADRVVAMLESRSVVAIVGASGTGKSSLVRAGVIPRWRGRGASVATFGGTGDLSRSDADSHRLARAIRDRDRTALEPVPAGGLLLFVDQFEDFAVAAPEQARAVLRWLTGLAGAGVTLLLTMRWEAIGELLDDELAEILGGATIPLAPMGRSQLRAVIRGPLTHTPGVEFDDAVVERMVDDTVGEPGALPLLESLLTELWEQRTSGRITLGDYNRVGGVQRSITRRADQALAQFRDPGERAKAERLLMLLAAPATIGHGFVRTVVSIRDHPELQSVAGQLAMHRIVVVGRDPDGSSAVELAHQALIDNWPALRSGLEADRDFRRWQVQLTADRHKWEDSGRDTGLLLRGGALATAEDRMPGREADLPQPDRDFVVASRRLRRREVRRWRSVTAFVAILAVLAAATAVAAYRTSQARTATLREQAGVNLAHQSEALGETQPEQALQFAEAAGKFAPGNPDVRAAQLLQQVRLGSLASRDARWVGMTGAKVSTDLTTMVASDDSGAIEVWHGLLSGTPSSWQVPIGSKALDMTLSPDGAKLAIVDDRGGISLWDTRSHSGPVTVRPDEPAPVRRSALLSMFSADSRQLFVSVDPERDTTTAAGADDTVEQYDVSGTPRRLAGIRADGTPTRVVLRGTESAVWTVEADRTFRSRKVVRELGTGREIGEWSGTLGANESVDCIADTSEIVVREWNGAERYRRKLGRCSEKDNLFAVDRTGQFAIAFAGKDHDPFLAVRLVHLATGTVYRVQIRRDDTPFVFAAGMTQDGPVLLRATPDGLERYRVATPVSPQWERIAPTRSESSWSPDGRFAEVVVGNDVTIIDTKTGGTGGILNSGVRFADFATTANMTMSYTPDNKHAAVIGESNELALLSVPYFTLERRIRLPAPQNLPAKDPLWIWRSTTAVRDNDEVGVLHLGALTRWRIADGTQIGKTIMLSTDPRELPMLARTTWLTGYLPQGNRAVIRNDLDKTVQVWDLDSGTMVGKFASKTGDVGVADARIIPGTSDVLIRQETGTLLRWNADTGERTKVDIPAIADDVAIAGWSPDGRLVLAGKSNVQIWDTHGGTDVSFTTPGSTPVWQVAGSTLFGLSDIGPLAIDIGSGDIQRRLCAIGDRPYTDTEREKLAAGIDHDPPCRG